MRDLQRFEHPSSVLQRRLFHPRAGAAAMLIGLLLLPAVTGCDGGRRVGNRGGGAEGEGEGEGGGEGEGEGRPEQDGGLPDEDLGLQLDGGAQDGGPADSGTSSDLGEATDSGGAVDAGGQDVVCTPHCGERTCGDDGCGGTCGSCGEDQVCSLQGQCVEQEDSCDNGSCEPERGEDCATCPADCGQCCGNGSCDPIFSEDCSSCPADCACTEPLVCRLGSCVEPEVNQAPSILHLSTSVERLTEGGSFVVSAVVTDPDGIDDLGGGVLEADSGASFGAFAASGQEGTYSLQLSWGELQAVSPIELEQGAELQRSFVATFFDQQDLRAQESFQITLHCAGLGACDGVCTDLTTTSDCGSCGNRCTTAGSICDGESCVCPEGHGVCDGRCTDLTTTDDCGFCGRRCTNEGELCINGSCSCPAGQEPCDDVCVDLLSDPYNCNECNNVCPGPGAGCEQGWCVCEGFCAMPGPGELVITEVMPNPDQVTDAHGEWFEILNVSDRALSLSGLSFGESDYTDYFDVNEDIRVEPGVYFVFARDGNLTTNGWLPADHDYSGMNLNNDGDELSIIDLDGQLIDWVAYDYGWPSGQGYSMQLGGQHDPSSVNNADFASWCRSEQTYGAGDYGTPGEANHVCP